MVVSYLQGGLGNNLFQVAASIGTGEFYGNDWKVQSDFKKFFSIPNDRYVDEYALPRYKEPHFHYSIIPDGDFQLFGYFQSEKYFKTSENIIRRLFEPEHRLREKILFHYEDLLKENTCSIHVRRGDYLKLSEFHYNLETEYYTSIIEMFPQFHYVCFSDDIEWCKENISAQVYIKDTLEVEFFLMSMCKNNIIANSSFSWWASWLNKNEDKMIFAPPKNKWFGVQKAHLNVDDLYCKNWIYEK